MEETIRDNIDAVRKRIEAAAVRSGRPVSAVRLMAVTKTVDDRRILEAVNAGVQILGENYVQEAKRKIEQMGRIVEWHFIGHLQTNKAKYAARLFDMVHSIDRPEVAEELNKRCAIENRIMKILIEVNVSGEATKRGVDPDSVLPLIEIITPLSNLSIQGLMTMAPWSDKAEDARPYFIALRKLRDSIREMNISGIAMAELSMGMSGDYEVAVEEGATILRIGSSIFGERPVRSL
ncbi:MAG: Pyridoxal phosphate homeostasis protein [Syntrophus sp. SKADARSKE-3]|nr:Pyridoxal phosphate homeostasis protein [Syntrophus sp. SKADARSKE-3]